MTGGWKIGSVKLRVPPAAPLPDVASDPVTALAARTLRSALVSALVYDAAFFAVILPFFVVRKLAGSVVFLIVVAATLASLFCLRKGNLRLASWIFVSAVAFFAAVLTLFSGGIGSPASVLYLPVVVLAAWLLGRRVALAYAVVCISATLVLAVLELAGVHPPKYFPSPPVSVWFITLFFAGITIVPLSQVLQTLADMVAEMHRRLEDLRRQEHKTRESEGRFRNVANSAPVMIAVFSPDKQASFFNKAWLDFRGHTMDDETGGGWRAALHPDDRDAALALYARLFDARAEGKFEYRFRRADGEYRWLLCSAAARFEPAGEFDGYIGCAVDITDLKRAQEETLARQKLETVGTLASGIAHDFNNLLGGILASVDVAEQQAGGGSEADEELHAIRSLAIRGAEIVSELMAYAGKDSQAAELIDISAVVEDMLALLKHSMSRRATLETDLGRDLPGLRGNAAEIGRIVLNLVTNAIDAMVDRPGVIRVSTGRVLISGGTAEHLAEGDYLRLEVSDTGRGIPPEMQTRIFDPFFTTKAAGSGLGLSVVQGIVRRLGGVIQVESEPDRGSTFRILLPCAERAAAPTDRAASFGGRPTPVLQHGTILIVEDEQGLRQPVSKMLRRTGFSVIEAGDGSAAIEAIRRHHEHIDVLLLDITIPGSSSREVFDEARRLRPEVKIIVTSAYPEEQGTAALQTHLDYFIRKPYRLRDLVDLILRALVREADGHPHV